jgi:hypothetical protein
VAKAFFYGQVKRHEYGLPAYAKGAAVFVDIDANDNEPSIWIFSHQGFLLGQNQNNFLHAAHSPVSP